MSSPRVHRLRVASVEQVAEDGVAIVLDVPEGLREEYRFQAGQHLTVVGEDGGRRSFSIAASPASGMLRIGVRRLPGGAFSDHVLAGLTPGDELEVMTPTGRFVALPEPERTAAYGAIAAGSGITPVLSIVTALLEGEPHSEVTLVLADRTTASAMFLDEVHDLKDRFADRLQLAHVLSREQQESELLTGRLDGPRLRRLLPVLVDVAEVDGWFLCGPHAMVEELRATLLDLGARQVRSELFHVPTDGMPTPPRPVSPPLSGEGTPLQFRLDGRTSRSAVPAGATVLDAALRVRPDLPYACRGGVCGTCRALVREGSVQMAAAYALEPGELEAGYVLTCQSRPTSDTLAVDYDT